MNFVILAYTAERAIIEEAQQLGLHAWRHFTNLVQQHGTAVSLLEEPFLPSGA